jgi:hypothetical protein
MKKNFVLLAFIASFVFISCEKQIADGDWDPIEVNKETLNFPKEGGVDSVYTQNYASWWICSGDQGETGNHIEPTTIKGEDGKTYQQIDGDWFKVTVLRQKPHSNTAVVWVMKNDTDSTRQAGFCMTVGDSFKYISIYQE